jgi:hypothetical protein
MSQANFILELYKDERTVFTLKDIAMLLNESNYDSLKQKIYYYVKTKAIVSLRKGIYAKENYNKEELACKLYTPAYISLEYVLVKAGIIFQYSETLTQLSYLSRKIEVGVINLQYRKIKDEFLYNPAGITRYPTGVNIACPERAIIDILYLNKNYHFDNLSSVNTELLKELLKNFASPNLTDRVLDIIT